MRRAALACLGALLLMASCQKVRAFPVETVEVSVQGADWPEAEAKAAFEERLYAGRRFQVLGKGEPKGSGWSFALRIEVERAGAASTPELRAAGVLELSQHGEVVQDMLLQATAKAPEPGPDGVRGAARDAAAACMAQAVKSAAVVLDSRGRSDADLVAQLASKDAVEAEWAAALLAERKNPAALQPLIRLLETSDLVGARWAMRWLIALRDPRAGPALIEASRAKDDTFQREVVFALGELGGDDAEAYLYTVAQGHDLPLMRQSATRALEELRARSGRDGGAR